jgi:hypothetical protein
MLSLRLIGGTHLAASAFVRESEEEIMTKIKTQLKDAMRSKDSFTSTVLRVC